MIVATAVQTEVVLIQQVGAVAIAIITVIGGVMVALLNRTRQHAKVAAANSAVVKNEVKNDHSTNLRDESDERHVEIITTLNKVLETQKVHSREIGNLHKSVGGIRDELRGMRDDDRQQREELDEERGRIRALEDARTHPVAAVRRHGRTT